MTQPKFVPLEGYQELPNEEMLRRATNFAAALGRRRTVRQFSDRPVPRAVIESCLRAAASAASGANMQPWKFVAVSHSVVKQRIRVKAEKEEYDFYTRRAPPEWLAALAPLGACGRTACAGGPSIWPSSNAELLPPSGMTHLRRDSPGKWGSGHRPQALPRPTGPSVLLKVATTPSRVRSSPGWRHPGRGSVRGFRGACSVVR